MCFHSSPLKILGGVKIGQMSFPPFCMNAMGFKPSLLYKHKRKGRLFLLISSPCYSSQYHVLSMRIPSPEQMVTGLCKGLVREEGRFCCMSVFCLHTCRIAQRTSKLSGSPCIATITEVSMTREIVAMATGKASCTVLHC